MSMTELDGLLVRLVGDSTSYDNMIDDAVAKLDGFVKSVNGKATKIANAVGGALKAGGQVAMQAGAAVGAAGAAMLAPMLAATKQFADAGDQLHKMSLRTGVSVESLSELKFAAEQSGSSIEAIGSSIQKLNRRIGRIGAGAGSASQTDALEKLGVDMDGFFAKNPEQRFLTITKAMSEYGDEAVAAGLAQRVMGRSVDQLLPFIKEGEAGIEALRKEARDLGLQMTSEDADAAAALTDAWNRMTKTAAALSQQVGAALAPTITMLADKFAGATTVAVSFIRNNRKLVVGIAAVAAGLIVAGGALALLGTAAVAAGFAITGITALISGIGTVIATVFSPVGLIVGGVVLAIAAMVAPIIAVASAFTMTAYKTGLLSDAWVHIQAIAGNLFETIKKTVGGITDALTTGDWKTAAHILWAGLKVAFFQGMAGVLDAVTHLKSKMWKTVKKFFIDWVRAAAKGAKTVAKIVLNPLGNKQQMVLDFIWDISDEKGGRKGIGGWVVDQRIAAEKELDGLVESAAKKREAMDRAMRQKNGSGKSSSGASILSDQDAERERAEAESQVESLIASVETPLEEYKRKRTEVLELVEIGAFDGQRDKVQRVMDKLKADYEKTLDTSMTSAVESMVRSVETPLEKFKRKRGDVLDLVKAGEFEGQEDKAVRVLDSLQEEYVKARDKTDEFTNAQKRAKDAVMAHNQEMKNMLRSVSGYNSSRAGIEGDIQRMRKEKGLRSATDVAFTPRQQLQASQQPRPQKENSEDKRRESEKVRWLKSIATNTKPRNNEAGTPAENVL